MNNTVLIEICVTLALLAVSAFFSSAETIFFSLSPLQLRRISQRSARAGKVIHVLLSSPTRILSTILIGNTVVNTALATLGFNVARRFVGGAMSMVVASAAVAVALIVAGEAGPKRFGLRNAEKLAPAYAAVLRLLIVALAPLRYLLEHVTRAFEPFFRPRGRTLTAEEFETALEIGGEEGIINGDELAMVKSIVRLEDLKVSDVMTPRVDLIGLDLEDKPAEFAEHARKAKRNFLLLHRGRFDDVEGILDVRKFLLDPDHNLARASLPPFFVPENAPVVQLLMRFQNEKKRIAVVVDEYGGTAGVCTRGDILEEITGEIYQELNKPRALFQSAGPGRWLVDAQISLGELNRKLNLNLDAEGADRLAGWLTAHIGHMPEKDDAIEAQGVRVTVLQTIKLRVTLAQIEIIEESAAEELPP